MKTERGKKSAAAKKTSARTKRQPAAKAPASDSETQARPATVAQPERSQKGRTRTGRVVSTKMQKTIVVDVEQRVPHPLYRKIVRRHRKLHAHDEAGMAKTGDWVKIQETRPLSRLKCWRLVAIVRSAPEEGVA